MKRCAETVVALALPPGFFRGIGFGETRGEFNDAEAIAMVFDKPPDGTGMEVPGSFINEEDQSAVGLEQCTHIIKKESGVADFVLPVALRAVVGERAVYARLCF